MVNDDTYLSPGEAAPRIGPDGVSRWTVREYFDEGLLRGRIRGKWHRQIEAASIEELNAVLDMPPGVNRETALRDLQQSNLKQRERREVE